jgi:hypothetical protein
MTGANGNGTVVEVTVVGGTVVGSAVVDGGGGMVVDGSVVGGGVLGDAVVGLVVDGSRAVDVDVDVEGGGAAVRPEHPATVKSAASANARNFMEQYYYDTSPSRRGEQPLR